MKTDLDKLYNPEITDLELDEHQGKDRPVIYLDQAKAVLDRACLRSVINELMVWEEAFKQGTTHRSSINQRIQDLKAMEA